MNRRVVAVLLAASMIAAEPFGLNLAASGRPAEPSANPAKKADGATLAIASTPADAAVYVDGQFVGRTPLKRPKFDSMPQMPPMMRAGTP